jgi:hypothetical protein
MAEPTCPTKEANPRLGEPVAYPPAHESPSECVPAGKQSYAQTLAKEALRPLREYLCWFPLVYGFLLEFRSLLHRMALRRERRYDLYGLDVGPCHQIGTDGRLRLNTRTRACNSDIESLAAGRPWATIIDLELYRDAWVKGAEWGDRSLYSYKSEQQNFSR